VVHNAQNCWLSGRCPSSGILNTREHDVSETDPVSETLCSPVFRIPDDGQNFINPVFRNVTARLQMPVMDSVPKFIYQTLYFCTRMGESNE
jgi:hypothetical protein